MKINGRKRFQIVLLFLILALSSVTVFSLASEVSQKISVTLEFGEKHTSFASLFYDKINGEQYPFALSGSKITFQIESGKTVGEINSYINGAAEYKDIKCSTPWALTQRRNRQKAGLPPFQPVQIPAPTMYGTKLSATRNTATAMPPV